MSNYFHQWDCYRDGGEGKKTRKAPKKLRHAKFMPHFPNECNPWY